MGEKISIEKFRNSVILVVNTASKCGFTYQFSGLEKLYQKYKKDGFVILGFPCNQFGWQDPGSNDEISEFCKINYGVTFPMFEKVDVNGVNAHPLFVYLKSELKDIMGERIKWNFTKFLVDKNGTPVKRFSPQVNPEKIEHYINKLL